MSDSLIVLNGIEKKYTIGDRQLHVLKNINLRVSCGEFVSVMGPSGSGKTTLLYLVGCLEKPTSGNYRFDGMDVLEASDGELSKLRSTSLGFVFQTFNLIPYLSLLENVELPFLYLNIDYHEARRRSVWAVKKVGLFDRRSHRPSELSGGEMQRAAIARAIAANPKLVLADEPTGNLDSRTGREILAIFRELHAEGTTIIMVTHDETVASSAQKIIMIQDGKIV
jgi:putative ABC transport system ATP-binding protein